MSHFEPYSAGDYHVWEQSQLNPPPPAPPPTNEQLQASAHRALAMDLHEYPKLQPILASLAAAAHDANPNELDHHVVSVEYRGLLGTRMTGRANTFKVLPCGTFKANGRFDHVFDADWAIRSDGKMFVRTPQDANVELRPTMRWIEAPAVPSSLDTHWRGRLTLYLLTKVPPEQHPDLGGLISQWQKTRYLKNTDATRANPASPVSRSAQRRADAIRRRTLPLSLAIDSASRAYEDPYYVIHGPKTRGEKKAIRRLERLRAKRDRALARANALDGYRPPEE